MNAEQIESKFAALGARVKFRAAAAQRGWARLGSRVVASAPDYAIDIRRDHHGQFFELRVPESLRKSLEVTIMQAELKQRHLLLLVRKPGVKPQLDRFLCGHDEREWFVAAVPGGASNVRQAMEALQPKEVRDELTRHQVAWRNRCTRKNQAFRRQGEWFFIPEPNLVADTKLILHQEPLRRGAGKPHLVEELHRTGGETVHVCRQHPNGMASAEYHAILQREPEAVRWGWQVMRRNPRVYARGTVRHRDHETITLPFWHRVLMNTETQTRTMANVAFLD